MTRIKELQKVLKEKGVDAFLSLARMNFKVST
ncbi:hypothetical protein Bealeia1_01865 [Candidatus Bealeia paramacronuclearis]|uniref:Uncharacterized protein n=1 Tax=Candidatus Bealeia paramacronuclearis TaxID=1921001 RepID=A0ABZ2C958_9PROT